MKNEKDVEYIVQKEREGNSNVKSNTPRAVWPAGYIAGNRVQLLDADGPHIAQQLQSGQQHDRNRQTDELFHSAHSPWNSRLFKYRPDGRHLCFTVRFSKGDVNIMC